MLHRVSATILILEREPYWTPELQRQFYGESIRIRGCRKWSELADDIHALVIVNFDEFASECLTGLPRRTHGAGPLIVIGSSASAELEFVLRDAGASAFFPKLPTGEELARCCRRWLR